MPTPYSPALTQRDAQRLFDAIQQRTPLTLIESGQLSPQLSERLKGAARANVVLATSGSRSPRPHLVGLSWRALFDSASATQDHLGGGGQWLLALPLHHIAGLQIIVRSTLSGRVPLVVENRAGFRPVEFARVLAEAPGDAPLFTSLVPTQLHKLLAAGIDLSRFSAILVGGARLEPSLREAANRLSLPLITTYGMSETCGGCAYDGVPLPGTTIRMVDGQIQISGSTLMDGYIDEPSPFIEQDGITWLTTNDLGHWEGNRLVVQGRADDVIITGGENVSAAAVQDAIREAFPHLAGIEVLGHPDPQWGHLVCAVVVGSATGPAVREAVAARLGPSSAPRVVVNLPELPLLSSGKPDRRAIERLVALAIGTGDAWQR